MNKADLDATRMRDPLGILSHSRKPPPEPATLTTSADDLDSRSSVNPLWMITAGLAAFVLLLVAVW